MFRSLSVLLDIRGQSMTPWHALGHFEVERFKAAVLKVLRRVSGLGFLWLFHSGEILVFMSMPRPVVFVKSTNLIIPGQSDIVVFRLSTVMYAGARSSALVRGGNTDTVTFLKKKKGCLSCPVCLWWPGDWSRVKTPPSPSAPPPQRSETKW